MTSVELYLGISAGFAIGLAAGVAIGVTLAGYIAPHLVRPTAVAAHRLQIWVGHLRDRT